MKTTFELLIAFVKEILSLEETIYVETILLQEKENIKIVERLNYFHQNNSLDKYLSELNRIESDEEKSDDLVSNMINPQEVIKYIKNELSVEEKEVITNHLEQNIYSKELYIDFLLLYNRGKLDNYLERQKIKSNLIFDELFVDAKIEEQNKQTAEIKQITISKKLWVYGLSIAATLIGLLLIFNFVFDNEPIVSDFVAEKKDEKKNLPATLGTENKNSITEKTKFIELAEGNIRDIEKKINTLNSLSVKNNEKNNRELIKWNIESITRFVNYKESQINIFVDSCKNYPIITTQKSNTDFTINLISCQDGNTIQTDLVEWANNPTKDSLNSYAILSYVAYYSQKNDKKEVTKWFRIEQKRNKEILVTELKSIDQQNDKFVRNNTNNFFKQITFIKK